MELIINYYDGRDGEKKMLLCLHEVNNYVRIINERPSALQNVNQNAPKFPRYALDFKETINNCVKHNKNLRSSK